MLKFVYHNIFQNLQIKVVISKYVIKCYVYQPILHNRDLIFFSGAYERQLKLPLTPTFDCSRTKVAKIQAGINFRLFKSYLYSVDRINNFIFLII